MDIDIRKEALEAEKRIREHIRETPLEFSPWLSSESECRVYLKLENFQITGSFKLRGAANKILSLDKESKKKGVATASTGNHGAAFAYLLDKFGIEGTIYVPENASPVKIESLLMYGTKIEYFGNDCAETEAFARDQSRTSGQVFIPPYNDPKIIGGQATIGIELERQIEAVEPGGKIDAVFVPVGGGGLISGIAGYLKSVFNDCEIVGCQPENSAVMAESIKAGKILEIESKPTISDGTAGGIEPGSVTFDVCREYVDEFILVTEKEIEEALALILKRHHLLVEGAAALAPASFMKVKERFKGKRVILLLSGSKIGMDFLKEIL